MTDIYTPSNYYLYALKKKMIDESSDTIRVLCMRSGFVFSKGDHAQLKNIKGDTTAMTLSINATTRTLSRSTGSFITDGFVVNNAVTLSGWTNAGNNTTKIIESVSALAVVFTVATGLVTEAGGGNERMLADDELATASGGYTQNTHSVGVVTVGPENDDYNYCDSTFPTVTITAVSANIGPSPGVCIYNVTADVIMGYLEYGAGEITKAPPEALNIGNGTLRLSNN